MAALWYHGCVVVKTRALVVPLSKGKSSAKAVPGLLFVKIVNSAAEVRAISLLSMPGKLFLSSVSQAGNCSVAKRLYAKASHWPLSGQLVVDGLQGLVTTSWDKQLRIATTRTTFKT
jgi:hypothetical protein